MNSNGHYGENIQTMSALSSIPVELWKSHSMRIPHPRVKAYQPVVGREGLKRLFKTRTSANNYALAVKLRYISLLRKLEYVE